MSSIAALSHLVLRVVRQFLPSAFGEESGAAAIVIALSLTTLIAVTGLGVEVSSWYMTKRSMQNAADAAALAAAANGSDTFANEAKAVADKFIFASASGIIDLSVTALRNVACRPSGVPACYSVEVSGSVPYLPFAKMAGLTGGINLRASALAAPGTRYCVVGLGDVETEDFLLSGGPKTNLSGCGVMSNTAARCNGQPLAGAVVDAVTSVDDCNDHYSPGGLVKPLPDPFRRIASIIPNMDCPTLVTTTWTIDQSFGDRTVCGKLQLAHDVSISAPGGGSSRLFIYNGDLDTNGYTLTGTNVSIVFTGDNGHSHIPTGNGNLEIAAPTSGSWSGVAIYQAPNMDSGVNIEYTGNSPAWNIRGLVYAPNSKITIKGAVNKEAGSDACFVLVASSIIIKGTGYILSHGNCIAAGLEMPRSRGRLVY